MPWRVFSAASPAASRAAVAGSGASDWPATTRTSNPPLSSQPSEAAVAPPCTTKSPACVPGVNPIGIVTLKATGLLQQAVALDLQYLGAWAALANVCLARTFHEHSG